MQLVQNTFVCDASIDDELMICHYLAAGYWMVEAGYIPVPAHDSAGALAWRGLSEGMALSVSSSTALRLALGPALVDWLERKGRFLKPLASLALHELIVNAAIHGNLGVSSGHLGIWQDLIAREAAIATARDDPSCCNRLVTIGLGWTDDRVVAIISDEGNGYGSDETVSPGRASGRGLRIARSVGQLDVFNGGRQVALTLDCRRSQAAG